MQAQGGREPVSLKTARSLGGSAATSSALNSIGAPVEATGPGLYEEPSTQEEPAKMHQSCCNNLVDLVRKHRRRKMSQDGPALLW